MTLTKTTCCLVTPLGLESGGRRFSYVRGSRPVATYGLVNTEVYRNTNRLARALLCILGYARFENIGQRLGSRPRMAALLPLFLLLTACEVTAPQSGDCAEFDHKTVHDGKAVVCRMVYCQGMTSSMSMSGGVATLWCDERTP